MIDFLDKKCREREREKEDVGRRREKRKRKKKEGKREKEESIYRYARGNWQIWRYWNDC